MNIQLSQTWNRRKATILANIQPAVGLLFFLNESRVIRRNSASLQKYCNERDVEESSGMRQGRLDVLSSASVIPVDRRTCFTQFTITVVSRASSDAHHHTFFPSLHAFISPSDLDIPVHIASS